MQGTTIEYTGEIKNSGNCKKPLLDSKVANGSVPDASALQKLLGASKEAEVLIACIFEFDSITAAPLLEIWNKFAAAINEAQLALQAEHSNGSSLQRERRL